MTIDKLIAGIPSIARQLAAVMAEQALPQNKGGGKSLDDTDPAVTIVSNFPSGATVTAFLTIMLGNDGDADPAFAEYEPRSRPALGQTALVPKAGLPRARGLAGSL